jgi:hypothetical protein
MPDSKKQTDLKERPSLTPDRNVEAAVEGTFPASDPVATTASQGARAVPAEEMMQASSAAARVPDDAVTLTECFPDAEAAKLALETLVRDGPVDRRFAQIGTGDGGVSLTLQAPRQDAKRLEEMLRGCARRG